MSHVVHEHDESQKESPLAHRSPEYVQISAAAAITLGLAPGRMYRTECTHCLNLLLTYPEGCRANCTYCGLARHRDESLAYAERNFIRVEWPTVPFDKLLDRVRGGADAGRFERMCISMITHPAATRDTLILLRQWVEALPQVPVSILSNPSTLRQDDLRALRDAGADIFTVALDAATPELFERTRGRSVDSPHSWGKYWRTLEWAAGIFGPGRIGAHLICGMGETERELLEQCQRIRDLGGHSHLFAFFPEQGTRMAHWPAVPQSQWRRVQIARFLIDHRNVNIRDMQFDEAGRVTDFGVPQGEVEAAIDSGKPFRTSGCPGKQDPEISACNRPFGDSGPADIRSFPFSPTTIDLAIVRRQLRGETVRTADRLEQERERSVEGDGEVE